jgi:UDP-N-acetylglucosamine--N-acetylmuramyl-(pentapeptide) pyrophosphoryl-undecaprenol N-acetylglucosamine transferase
MSGRSVERTSVRGWEGHIVTVRAAGFPAGVSIRSVGVALGLGLAVLNCIVKMGRRRPDVLLAMGSYASVGPVLAAWLHRVPVVLHEANAVPGRAVSFLSRFASAVGVTFEAASRELGGKAVLTGLPLRSTLTPRFPDDQLCRGIFTVLIMGGSQGAHVLNDIGSMALCALHAGGMPVQVVHLTGRDDENAVRRRYAEAGVPHLVFPFLEDMSIAYGAAHVAVCRSGAATCMELAACGVPALLVPLPTAARDHQTANAQVLAAAGAADLAAQGGLSVEGLREYLQRCAGDSERRNRMQAAMKALAVPDAAERLAELVERAGAKRGTRN